MLYLKFYDEHSELMNKFDNLKQFPDYLKIDPENNDLAYTTYKGTTFKRKLMSKNKLDLIPREFGTNTLTIDNLVFNRLETILATHKNRLKGKQVESDSSFD